MGVFLEFFFFFLGHTFVCKNSISFFSFICYKDFVFCM
jgi:hypothetical protein